MRSVKVTCAATLALCLLVCVPAVYSQTATGEVNGTVTDAQGAVVPNASVKLINQGTKIETTVSTNGTGDFTFINVQPGSYVLRVEKQGFKKVDVAAFDVAVNQTIRQQIKLDIGATTETLEVTAQSTLIQPTTTELGTVIQERPIHELPLNGRNFTQLLILTPGITPVATSQGSTSVGTQDAGITAIPNTQFYKPSVNGQANRESVFLLDGIENTDLRGAVYGVEPILDTINEFKVQSHNDKAEFGGVLGGVVNVATKSGTNNFHGSGWEFLRNNIFDARNKFTDICNPARCPGFVSSPVPVPTKTLGYHQNQFGAAAGGPIFKNKTFFFAAYEGWRYNAPLTSSPFHIVPTNAELQGDFTNSLIGSVVAGTFRPNFIYNPYSPGGSTRFLCLPGNVPAPINTGPTNYGTQSVGTPCNVIPSALINQQVVKLFQAYALPPNLTPVPGSVNFNYVESRSEIDSNNSWQLRLDHKFGERDNVFVRLSQMWVSDTQPIQGTVSSNPALYHAYNFGGAWDHVITPNLIADFRAGALFKPYTFYQNAGLPPNGFTPETNAGFTGIDTTKGFFLSGINSQASDNGITIGSQGQNQRGNPVANFDGSLSWIKGKHNIKGGFQYVYSNRYQQNLFQQLPFSNRQTSQGFSNAGGTGNSLSSALLGLPDSLTIQLPALTLVHFRATTWAGYIQDEWHLTPTLTINAGLRYDYTSRPHVLNNRPLNALDLFHQQWDVAESSVAACPTPPAFTNPCIPGGFPNANFNVNVAGINYNTANSIVFTGRPVAIAPIRDNVGPRLGLAWQIFPGTVLRAGYGIFYDTLTARSQYAQNTLEGPTWPWTIGVSAQPYNQTNAAGGAAALTSISSLVGAFPTPVVANTPWLSTFGGFTNDPKYTDPRSQQWNLNLEHQFGSNMMFSLAYVGSKTTRIDWSGKANAAQFPSPAVTDAVTTTPHGVTTCGPTGSATNTAACRAAYATAVNNLRVVPWMNSGWTYSQSTGHANYNSFQAQLQRRFSNGLQGILSYTWSKCLATSSGWFNVENGAGSGGAVVENFFNKKTSYGPCGYDVPHYVALSTVYELPFGRGKSHLNHGVGSWILGNWETNLVFLGRTGQNFNINANGDTANISGSIGSVTNYNRPNVVTGVAIIPAHQTAQMWFNPAAFSVPDGTFGNFGVGVLRDQTFYNVDFSLAKNFPIAEGKSLQLRFEGFNVLNLQILGTPAATINSGTPGVINTLASTPRQLQMAVKFTF